MSQPLLALKRLIQGRPINLTPILSATIERDDVEKMASKLLSELRDLVNQENLLLTQALTLFTSNVASLLLLNNKGRLALGMDADIFLFDNELQLTGVFTRAQEAMINGKTYVKGTFEE